MGIQDIFLSVKAIDRYSRRKLWIVLTMRGKERKDNAFGRRFNESPSIIPGCPGMLGASFSLSFSLPV